MTDELGKNLRSLFDTLSSSSPSRGQEAASIASDVRSLCVERITDAELAYTSSLIFNKDNGVIQFLRDSLLLDEFAVCKDELLHLLHSIVDSLGPRIAVHAVDIKEVCVSLFLRDRAARVKNATLAPLTAVVKLCQQVSTLEASLNVPDMVKKYYQAVGGKAKCTPSVKGAVYQLLGTFCETFPEHMMEYSSRIIAMYIKALKEEMGSTTRKTEMTIIAGSLQGLAGYLVHFTQSAAEGAEYAKDIYLYTRKAINPEIQLTRYDVPKAGLLLISRHAAQFQEYLARDYNAMYSCLFKWCNHNNKDIKKLAFPALEAFLQQVSAYILQEGDDSKQSDNEDMFRFFIREFRTIIDNRSSGQREISVAIRGYGHFAAPCRHFMKEEDIHFMFNDIIQRSEQVFSQGGESELTIYHLPSLLESLASIVKEMKQLSELFLSSLERLVVMTFECYPRLATTNSKLCHFALYKLFLVLSYHPTTILKNFLSHIIYQGLVRSCSYPVVIDVGDGSATVSMETPTTGSDAYSDNTDAVTGKPVSYKDFVGLWSHLLNPSRIKGLGRVCNNPEQQSLVHHIIYIETMTTIISVIQKLDLSAIQPQVDHDSLEYNDDAMETDVTTSDSKSPPSTPDGNTHAIMATGLEATVPKDFQIFINLVDLSRAILLTCDVHMFEGWVMEFGKQAIIWSSRYPLVSGFYKLLAIDMTMCRKLDYFKEVNSKCDDDAMDTSDVVAIGNTEKQLCFSLFSKFIKEVMVRMKQYKDELLASCLHLLLSLPWQLVQVNIAALVPALQIAFRLGLSYLPLAMTGIDALEQWSRELEPSVMMPHYKHVLPYLNDYLKSSSTDAEEEGTTVVSSNSSRSARTNIKKAVQKWKEGIEGSGSSLEKVRLKIVTLLGSLGGCINGDLIRGGGENMSHAIVWDVQDKLSFALPFQDMKPTMYLDPFLPRCCELATSSNDRQTKIAACELLHAMVLVMLGRAAQPATQDKAPMNRLYRKVFPVILQLGCDVEQVAERLFSPLVFQIIHWFTSNKQYESPDTIALLEAILDGIVHPTDTALRNFSTKCIKHFLEWSLKQTSKKQLETNPANVKSLLKRIYSLAGHPSAIKRLGAASTINTIYTVFREEDALISTFIIEMICVMLHSLKLAHKDDPSLGTAEQAQLAIDHITRIIQARANLLNKPNKLRRLPRGLRSAELSALVVWLLEQCGSPETSYRQQCIVLLTKLTTFLPGVTTASSWIRNKVDANGSYYFIKCFEQGGATGAGIRNQPRLPGEGSFMLTQYISWCDKLHAAIDCYSWAFSSAYLAPSEVFSLKSPSDNVPSKMLDVIGYYVNQLAMLDIGSLAGSDHYSQPYNDPFLPHEEELYNKSRCTLVTELLRFLTILLQHHPKDTAKAVPNSFWSDDLLTVIMLCCIDPQGVGCDLADVRQTDTMYAKVKEMLLASQHLPATVRSRLMAILCKKLTDSSFNLSNLMTLTFGGSDPCDHVIVDLLSGALRTLQQARLLDGVFPSKPLQEVAVELLNTVVRLATPTNAAAGSGDLVALSPAQSKICGTILQLALEIGPAPGTLINSLVTTGSHVMLYHIFPDLFNAHFCTNLKNYVTLILSNAASVAKTTAHILNGLMNYISKDKQHRKQFALPFTQTLLLSWQQLSSWWSREGTNELKTTAVNLLKRALVLEPKVISDVSSSSYNTTFEMFIDLLSDPSLQLPAKVKVLGLLVHFTSAPADKLSRLRDSLRRMVADQFPLKSTELPLGSPQYHDYVSAIDKLLHALVVTGSNVILDVLIGIICQDPCQLHVCEDQIQLSFNKFITSVTVAVAMEAINTGYVIFTNEDGYRNDVRRAVMERVCLPLLRVCSEQVLREFFLKHICDIVAVLETRESRVASDTVLETQLVSKMCAFALVGLLYQRLPAVAVSSPESSINKTFCKTAGVKSGKELTQAVTKLAHTAKSEDLHGDTTLKELRRQYHCAAYNTLVAIVSCTQKELKFYTGFLFTENPLKGQFLWDNMIDVERHYQFDIEVDKRIGFKKQLNIIREDKPSSNGESDDSTSPVVSGQPRYLSSLFLVGSSLSEDVSQFDFSTGAHVIPTLHSHQQTQNRTSQKTDTVVSDQSELVSEEEKVEQDELNTHEVMATLTQLLTHMERNNISPTVDEGTQPTEMPSWMNCLYKTFTGSSTKGNVRLFIARLITNRPKVFQPYARFWLEPLIQLLVTGDDNEGMHYLVVEIVVTMLIWAHTAIPDDRFMASRLLEYLMQNAGHSNWQVFKNNLEVIKTLVECWRNKLDIPTKTIYQFFSNPSLESKANLTGIQLLGIIVANGLAPFDPTTSGSIDEKKFYTALVANLKNKYKVVHSSTAEVLGMVLNYIAEKKHVDSSPIHDLISNKLSEMMSDTKADDKFIICLHKLQQFYPQLSDRFTNKVLFMLPSHHGIFRTMLLEIMLSRAQVIPNLFMELRTKGLVNMMGHRDEATQVVCLQLVEAILQTMGVADVAHILPHVTFSAHPSVQCRQLMYNILMWLYNHTSVEEGAEVLGTVKDHLLQGLTDDSEAIRLKLFAFWNQESCLPSDALGRLRQLLVALYSPNTEREFLKYSTNLLLELTSRTPDYNKSPFDAPLSECKFEDFQNIDLSWQQKHLQMTPLFAATQAATQAADVSSSLQPGMIRATMQSMAFTPTQEEGSYSWMTPSIQSQDHTFNIGSSSTTQEEPQSAMLFTVPKSRPSRLYKPVGPGFGRDKLKPPASLSDTPASQDDSSKSEVTRLKRRFLKNRTAESSFFAKMELRKKLVRQEQQQRQKAARGSRVVLYRRYREGELPDIQIKYSDVIRPLQALAQKDSSLSRLLFSSLLSAILLEMEQVLTETEVDTARTAIREGIQQTLQSSLLYHPPFIGGIQDICYHEKHLQLEPSVVSTTALNGCQQLIGIMLLEKQVLNSSADELPKKSKRAKGLPSETTTMWIELGKLYKTLGNFDVLRGIFSGHIGTKDVTKLALEAEERSDYYTAQQLYKEALGRDDWSDVTPTQEEEDLWDQSLLNCYEQLTKWPELEQAVMVNVDDNDPPSLDKIWEDSYRQEQYLPFLLHAKLKMACSGDLDPSLVSFIEMALLDEDRKSLLENNYSYELALFNILRDDNDRANYYIDSSYQLFIRDWSNLNSLLSSTHHNRLHSLQKLREMKEYLLFVTRKDNFYTSVSLDQLLEKWKRRCPHSKLDPVSVWDDIISIRCMMLQKILSTFKTSHSSVTDSISSMDCETTLLTELETKVTRSMIEYYLQIADTARLQSNYDVAIRYLKITENAMNEVPGDTDLPLLLLHTVVKLRLQQAHTSPTPTSWMSNIVPLFDKMAGYDEEKLSLSLKRKHFVLLGNTQQVIAGALSEQGDQLLTDAKLIHRLAKGAGVSDKKVDQLSSKDIVHKLNLRILSSYKTATAKDHQMSHDASDLVEALLAMANWCNKLLRAEEEEDGEQSGLDTKQFPSVLVSHVLKAMGLGSPMATQLFPRLLQLVEKYPDTRKLFQAKSKSVPCWMFIGWINQMVALLNKPEGVAVHEILISIATEYPQALCYPFKISTSSMEVESTDGDLSNRATINKLKDILNFSLVDDFIAALEQLTSPELAFKDLCQNDLRPLLEPSIAQRDNAAIKKTWQQLCAQLLDYKSWESMGDSLYASSSLTVGLKQKKFAQDYFKKVEAVFGKNAEKLVKMKLKEYDQQMVQLQDGMKAGLKRCEGAGLLKDYSPWLQNFQSTNYHFTIEIPGQYTGNNKPLPEYHVKISSFDEKVLVLSSIRKPKRITVRGDDEKEYMFLVKGGEDLRLDQRIEQLFAVMNNILVSDSSCGQRELSLKTYQVIPMTPRLGVIEWVNNTKPLKDFLLNAMTTGEQKNSSNAVKLHNEWLKKFGYYKDMYKKASRDDVETQYKKKVACYPWDLMRRAFIQLSSSPEAFLVLRSHFTKTYATLCVCQYVLGIGDRHLSNFMIDLSTGGVVGIDFGHAFGTATQFLPFPELMPFRLTPQIINLLRPLTESGELRSCMTHTMRALRHSPDLLLNTMDVFVKEPSLDWKMFARKQAQAQGGDPDTHEKWYPRAKVEQAKKKLLGYNSCHIMEADLKHGHGNSKEFPSLRTILMGDRRHNKRAQAGAQCDTIEEQIACLIDHATDSNILGRTWSGWEPWV